jgi:hypothetical protein
MMSVTPISVGYRTNYRAWPRIMLVLVGIGIYGAARAEATNFEPLLGDAQVAMERYQELEAGFHCGALRVSSSRKDMCVQMQHDIGFNVQRTMGRILRASKAHDAKNIDLFDIYHELVEVAARLTTIAYQIDDSKDAVPIAEAQAKTTLLASKFYLALRQRIHAFESTCSQ